MNHVCRRIATDFFNSLLARECGRNSIAADVLAIADGAIRAERAHRHRPAPDRRQEMAHCPDGAQAPRSGAPSTKRVSWGLIHFGGRDVVATALLDHNCDRWAMPLRSVSARGELQSGPGISDEIVRKHKHYDAALKR